MTVDDARIEVQAAKHGALVALLAWRIADGNGITPSQAPLRDAADRYTAAHDALISAMGSA